MHCKQKCKKLFFQAHLCQNCINLHQTKTKMTTSPFCIYCQIHFISGNPSFLW